LIRAELVQMNEPFFNRERPASYQLKDVQEKAGC
jgi:hypothetical protein